MKKAEFIKAVYNKLGLNPANPQLSMYDDVYGRDYVNRRIKLEKVKYTPDVAETLEDLVGTEIQGTNNSTWVVKGFGGNKGNFMSSVKPLNIGCLCIYLKRIQGSPRRLSTYLES